MGKTQRLLVLLGVLIVPITASCGSYDNTPVPQSGTELTSLEKQLSDISTKLDDINEKIKKIKGTTTTTTSSTTKASTAPQSTTITTNTTTSSAKPTSGTSSTPTPQPTTDTTDPKIKGRQLLDSIIKKINTTAEINAQVDKYERSLKTNDSSTFNLKLWCRKGDNLVKIDVVNSSRSSSVGTKILYTSGNRNDKLKIRPGGALSLITTSLSRTDDRIVSLNGYILDDSDFYGLAKRLSDSNYEAELIGTSTVNNTDVYVLKVTCKSTNSLDSQIQYEHVSFEPKTLNIRAWEAFDGKSDDAYFRLQLSSVIYNDSVNESDFNF